MLYLLGALEFSTGPFSLNSFGRDAGADLVSKAVMGGLQPSEFTGEGEDIVSIAGQLLPFHLGGLSELEKAHDMRVNGVRFPLMRGDGNRLGTYAFTRISETHEEISFGGVGFVIKHRMKLRKVQEDDTGDQQAVTDLMSIFDILR